jgi:hypothetical protein
MDIARVKELQTWGWEHRVLGHKPQTFVDGHQRQSRVLHAFIFTYTSKTKYLSLLDTEDYPLQFELVTEPHNMFFQLPFAMNKAPTDNPSAENLEQFRNEYINYHGNSSLPLNSSITIRNIVEVLYSLHGVVREFYRRRVKIIVDDSARTKKHRIIDTILEIEETIRQFYLVLTNRRKLWTLSRMVLCGTVNRRSFIWFLSYHKLE